MGIAFLGFVGIWAVLVNDVVEAERGPLAAPAAVGAGRGRRTARHQLRGRRSRDRDRDYAERCASPSGTPATRRTTGSTRSGWSVIMPSTPASSSSRPPRRPGRRASPGPPRTRRLAGRKRFSAAQRPHVHGQPERGARRGPAWTARRRRRRRRGAAPAPCRGPIPSAYSSIRASPSGVQRSAYVVGSPTAARSGGRQSASSSSCTSGTPVCAGQPAQDRGLEGHHRDPRARVVEAVPAQVREQRPGPAAARGRRSGSRA